LGGRYGNFAPLNVVPLKEKFQVEGGAESASPEPVLKKAKVASTREDSDEIFADALVLVSQNKA